MSIYSIITAWLNNIQDLVDRLFSRSRYSYRKILKKYSHALTRPMTDLDRFSKLAPYLLWKSMRLTGASFMVLDREARQYVVRAAVGESEESVDQTVPENSRLIQEILARRRELDKKELADAEITADLDRLKTNLIIPSVSESEYFKVPTLLCAINLGRKISNEPFSRDDLDFLETIANQAAIGIEYAFIMEEFRKNQAQIVRQEKLATLGTTTAGIAHELKNPLTYLLTVAQSMAANWDNPSFKESVLNMLPSEVERMKLIIDGLSDYSKTHELRLEPVDLLPVLEKAVAILGYEIKKNNVFIIRNFPAGGRAVARADKNRLVQIFMNVITNAVQALGEKGGDLAITVSDHENEVRISFADSGPGIPQEKLKKIFDPFYTTRETGTGLGLSITKKLVEEHNGSIYIDSRPGEGTTFTVCLPK